MLLVIQSLNITKLNKNLTVSEFYQTPTSVQMKATFTQETRDAL